MARVGVASFGSEKVNGALEVAVEVVVVDEVVDIVNENEAFGMAPDAVAEAVGVTNDAAVVVVVVPYLNQSNGAVEVTAGVAAGASAAVGVPVESKFNRSVELNMEAVED